MVAFDVWAALKPPIEIPFVLTPPVTVLLTEFEAEAPTPASDTLLATPPEMAAPVRSPVSDTAPALLALRLVTPSEVLAESAAPLLPVSVTVLLTEFDADAPTAATEMLLRSPPTMAALARPA